MKKHTLLCEYLGENFGTASDPIRAFDAAEDMRLLSQYKSYCASFDDDRLVIGAQYEIRDIELPDWLQVDEWIERLVAFKYLWAVVPAEWPEAWQRGLLGLPTAEKLVCRALLQTRLNDTFKSRFRESLAGQLIAWLEAPPESRPHQSPFSKRQWSSLVNEFTARRAKALDESLYAGGRRGHHDTPAERRAWLAALEGRQSEEKARGLAGGVK